MSNHNNVKPFVSGLGYVLDHKGYPMKGTREKAQRVADKFARHAKPHGKWSGTVFDAGDYFRINVGAKV